MGKHNRLVPQIIFIYFVVVEVDDVLDFGWLNKLCKCFSYSLLGLLLAIVAAVVVVVVVGAIDVLSMLNAIGEDDKCNGVVTTGVTGNC